MTAPSPVELERPRPEEVADLDRPWIAIVWNDPINLMSYVTYVFQTVFGYPKDKAEKLMLDVHHKGRAVLRGLLEQLLALMEDLPDGDPGLAEIGISENTTQPEDAVLARLFPDGYQEDPEAAGEFRRYTEAGLRDGKRAAAETVIKTLGNEVSLDQEQAQAWLRALNDLRLALGTRLEITEEFYSSSTRLDPTDPRAGMFAAYDWLTALQDSLVHALM